MKCTNQLRVGGIPVANFFQINGTAFSGVESNLVRLFAETLNLAYKVIIPPDLMFGNVDEFGNATGLMKLLVDKEADIAVSAVGITEDRFRVADFTLPFIELERIFFTRKIYLPKTVTFIYPFTPLVWFSILLFLLLVTLTFRPIIFKTRSIPFTLIMFLGSLFNQELERVEKATLNRFLLAVWLIYSNFTTLFYSSVLLAFLTAPVKMKPFANVEELFNAVTSGSHKAVAPYSTLDVKILLNSDQNYLKGLGEYFRKNKAYYSVKDEFIPDENTAVMASRIYFEFVFGNPDLYNVIDESIGTYLTAIAIRKDFCHKHRIQSIAHRVLSAGLYQKWLDDTVYKMKLKKEQKNLNREGAFALTTEVYQGAFIILVTGYILAFLVLLLEIYFKNSNLSIFL